VLRTGYYKVTKAKSGMMPQIHAFQREKHEYEQVKIICRKTGAYAVRKGNGYFPDWHASSIAFCLVFSRIRVIR
jgi:hypothetical protein